MSILAFTVVMMWIFFWFDPDFYGRQMGRFVIAYRKALEASHD